jgi:hypothetical protein
LARREERLRKLAEARAKIEARAKQRFEREQAEYEAKIAARNGKTKATGKKPGGKPPEPPDEGPGRWIRSEKSSKDRRYFSSAAARSAPDRILDRPEDRGSLP